MLMPKLPNTTAELLTMKETTSNYKDKLLEPNKEASETESWIWLIN